MPSLRAYGLNCTLKAGPDESSSQKLLDQVLQTIAGHGASTGSDRAVDHDIKPGVRSDEGPGDDWPALRQRVLAADIFVLATPVWLGQPSSVCKRVLERMDAFLGETDECSRYPSYGRVAAVCVVGNEDGAHHICAELYQALADVGFTIPASGAVYWVGEAMGSTDYKDLEKTPDKVASTIRMLASNATHLAGLLKQQGYPGVG